MAVERSEWCGVKDEAVYPPRPLKAPFPWFGGKSRVAHLVWERFGEVPNYVEPFFGSGAVLLGRPDAPGCETVNDKDGMIANFWRAVQSDPEAVAFHADHPVNENDLHARHVWLVNEGLPIVSRLEGDPDFYDARIAGWWCWGLCCWIGSGWCSGRGPWGISDRQLVHLGTKGKGVNRQLVHLGTKGKGVNRQLVHLGDKGKGVNRKLVHLGDKGQGVNRKLDDLIDWFAVLAERLKDVRVTCGDWSRILGGSPTHKIGMTGVFLDPPYGSDRTDVYATECKTVHSEVRTWCLENGDHPRLRIALCGYEGEHNDLEGLGWDKVEWRTRGGYGLQGQTRGRENAGKERIWFSPQCLNEEMPKGLFG